MKLLILIIAMVALSGCMSMFKSDTDRVSEYKQLCVTIGYPVNSLENANCTLKMMEAHHSSKSNSGFSVGPAQPSGMSFMCKEALARGDQGAIRVHC